MSKDSFIIYQEYADYIADLTGDEVKALFMAIFMYREGKEVPDLTGMAKAYFKVIRNNLDRDEQKYEAKIQARVEAGRMGGKQKQANLANASFATPSKANVAVSVPVPGNVSVPVSEPEEREADGWSVSQSGVSSQNGSTRIETARALWNASGVKPEERYTVLQFKPDDITACLATVQAFTDDDIADALKNYRAITKSAEHDVAYPYRSFVGFMRTGVAKFVTSADPWTMYRKKSAPAGAKPVAVMWPGGGSNANG